MELISELKNDFLYFDLATDNLGYLRFYNEEVKL
jgi:hypothetical protein